MRSSILIAVPVALSLALALESLSAQQRSTVVGGCLDPDRPTRSKGCDEPLDDYIRSEMREMKIPGLSVAVVQRGEIVRANGYGLHHDGQFPGFRSDYERFPDDQLSVIVLANLDDPGVESLAMKIAGFYARALAGPPFALSVRASTSSVSKGQAISITPEAGDDGKAAPASVMELEIRDASDSLVYRQRTPNQNFLAGETKSHVVSWQRTKPGVYSVNVAVYGPKAVPMYARRSKAITFIAE